MQLRKVLSGKLDDGAYGKLIDANRLKSRRLSRIVFHKFSRFCNATAPIVPDAIRCFTISLATEALPDPKNAHSLPENRKKAVPVPHCLL